MPVSCTGCGRGFANWRGLQTHRGMGRCGGVGRRCRGRDKKKRKESTTAPAEPAVGPEEEEEQERPGRTWININEYEVIFANMKKYEEIWRNMKKYEEIWKHIFVPLFFFVYVEKPHFWWNIILLHVFFKFLDVNFHIMLLFCCSVLFRSCQRRISYHNRSQIFAIDIRPQT